MLGIPPDRIHLPGGIVSSLNHGFFPSLMEPHGIDVCDFRTHYILYPPIDNTGDHLYTGVIIGVQYRCFHLLRGWEISFTFGHAPKRFLVANTFCSNIFRKLSTRKENLTFLIIFGI